MFVCNNCGDTADELPEYTKDYGFGCLCDTECYCGGNFVDAKKCEICGKWIPQENYSSVCDECLEESITFETAINVGEQDYKRIVINGYLASEFTVDEIESILKRELLEAEKLNRKLKYKEYCLENKQDLANEIEKEI